MSPSAASRLLTATAGGCPGMQTGPPIPLCVRCFSLTDVVFLPDKHPQPKHRDRRQSGTHCRASRSVWLCPLLPAGGWRRSEIPRARAAVPACQLGRAGGLVWCRRLHPAPSFRDQQSSSFLSRIQCTLWLGPAAPLPVGDRTAVCGCTRLLLTLLLPSCCPLQEAVLLESQEWCLRMSQRGSASQRRRHCLPFPFL